MTNNQKRILALFILTLSLKCVSGQTFSKDWTTFAHNKWTIILDTNSRQLFNHKSAGQLRFINKNDKSLIIIFEVFAKEIIDSSFDEVREDWYKNISCHPIEVKEKTFLSFYLHNYFYALLPCDKCYGPTTTRKSDCESLASKLLFLINSKRE
jgi:hypothetical protein